MYGGVFHQVPAHQSRNSKKNYEPNVILKTAENLVRVLHTRYQVPGIPVKPRVVY